MLWDIIDFSVNQEFPWCKLMGGGSGRRVTHQELSGAVRGQDPDPRPGEARPASCHLSDTSWDHPSGWERPTMGGEKLARSQTTCTWKQESAHTSRHVSCARRYVNKCLCTHSDIHALLYACTLVWTCTILHAGAILGTICSAVHMNHSLTDRSGKQKWHTAIKLNRHK